MAYYLALVWQVGVFAFAVEVAVAGAGIGGFLYGVYCLLKNIVYKLIVGEMQL